MTTKVFTDRSRILAYQRCPRSRWHEYSDGPEGYGIRKVKLDLPLAVGKAVHVGLGSMLSDLSKLPGAPLRAVEENAVNMALADFRKVANSLELDAVEQAALTPADFGTVIEGDPELEALAGQAGARRGQFEAYLAAEQSALVEAMVRAYARRRLAPLLEQFEVLEVEREGQWQLWTETHHVHKDDNDRQICAWCGKEMTCSADFDEICLEGWFMSRPDALLLDRQTRELVLLSYKTTSDWDIRRQKDAEHDMQGLSEGIEIERRLAEWWSQLRGPEPIEPQNGRTQKMVDYLMGCDAPPRILAVRYEFLMKGYREKAKDLSAQVGMSVKQQRSHLIRGYQSVGKNAKPGAWNWSWDYLKPDGSGEQSKLAYVNWKSAAIWEHMSIREWIDMLDSAVMTQSTEADSDATGFVDSREMGYSCAAQATGYTAAHPLDAAFVAPVIVYRNEDDLRDMVEQIEAQEVGIAEAVVQIRGTTDTGERRHLMNVHFPMHRSKCEWPSTCSFVKICYGGEDIRRDPLGSGQYVVREPNHPQERG